MQLNCLLSWLAQNNSIDGMICSPLKYSCIEAYREKKVYFGEETTTFEIGTSKIDGLCSKYKSNWLALLLNRTIPIWMSIKERTFNVVFTYFKEKVKDMSI